jgi:capsular exopolysaccharide synthesis family protein
MARRKQSRPKEAELDPFDDEEYLDTETNSSRERLQQLIRDLLGRWHWIALGLVLGVLGALYYLAKAPNVYQATSSLLVKQGAATMIPGNQTEDMDLRSDDAVNTVAERVKRLDLLTLVAQLPEIKGLDGLIPEPTNWFPDWSQDWLGGSGAEAGGKPLTSAELGATIAKWMEVSVRRNTRLLDITIQHRSPEIAQKLADAIANAYIDELTGKRLGNNTSSSDILRDQAEEARLNLQTAQNALANYQQVLEILKDLEIKEVVFNDLDLRYKSKHPKHLTAKAALDDYQGRFLSEFDLVKKASADKAYWEKKREQLDQPDLDVTTRLQIVRRLLTARATVLGSEIKSQDEVFSTVLTKMQENDINKLAKEAEVELSNLSDLPKVPSSPRKMIVLAGMSILGLGSGLALAFLLTKLDNKIHTVIQAELLTKLPVLATIHKTEPKILEKIIAEKGVDVLAPSPGREKWDPRIIFREGLTDSIYAETFRILRASVSLLGDEKSRKITLFSSALPGEGKTLTSANFAIASAQQGKKTLLIDLDLRKPAVHKVFGLKRNELKPGVTELLAGRISWQEALTTKTGQENLSCLFAGVKAPNPGELLNPKAVTDLLASLEGDFDVIVIDSAPLLSVPDTRLLIPLIDNFCLVIRAEQTPKSAVRKVIELLEDDGANPAGIVINGFEEKTGFLAKKYGYGYGGYGQYGKGYGYGSYGSYGSDDDS